MNGLAKLLEHGYVREIHASVWVQIELSLQTNVQIGPAFFDAGRE